MSEHTLKDIERDLALVKKVVDSAKSLTETERGIACVAAFRSPDGRTIATEDIGEGVVFQLRDALNQMQDWACKFESMLKYESLKDEKQFGKKHGEARALLSSLKVQGPET